MATTQVQDPAVVTRTLVESLHDTAVDKIMQETGCPRDEATAGLDFIQRMVNLARGGERYCDTPGTHHLTDEEMNELGYVMMDIIMPHGETATPGSAHAAVETVVLGDGDGEFAVVHDNPTGQPQDCIVTVTVRSMS